MNIAFTPSYREMQRTSPRSIARRAALDVLSLLANATHGNAPLRSPRVQFLYLHHLFPDEVASFRGMMAFLARDHRFISHSEAVGRVKHGPIDAPYIAFSFDDGLKSCLTAAAVLEEFGTTACGQSTIGSGAGES
jgi:hypothetical protein